SASDADGSSNSESPKPAEPPKPTEKVTSTSPKPLPEKVASTSAKPAEQGGAWHQTFHKANDEFRADHWQAARTLYLALRDQLKIEPMSDFRKLSCQHHLGLIAEQLGNLEESLTIYQSCLDPMAKSFGAADLTKPGVQARMAVVEFKQGHADQ